jgi:hypothetical protein
MKCNFCDNTQSKCEDTCGNIKCVNKNKMANNEITISKLRIELKYYLLDINEIVKRQSKISELQNEILNLNEIDNT